MKRKGKKFVKGKNLYSYHKETESSNIQFFPRIFISFNDFLLLLSNWMMSQDRDLKVVIGAGGSGEGMRVKGGAVVSATDGRNQDNKYDTAFNMDLLMG